MLSQRRSSDGFVSATGMFKLAFPWAQHAEEQAERDYIKNLPSSSQDEVAGNVWISESFGKHSRHMLFSPNTWLMFTIALELANDYQIVPWIAALLDEEEVKNPDETRKTISPPPPYKFSANDKTTLQTSTDMPRASTPGRGRGRPRASSPIKGGTPGGKSGSPRKQRSTKSSKEANAAASKEANASLQAMLDKEAEAAESESVDGERAVNGEKGTIRIENTTLVNGEGETTTTALKFELPGGSAEIPAPENAEQMIEEAKAMVAEVRKLEGESSTTNAGSGKGKRKVEELEEDSDENGEDEQQPTKKARLLEQKLTRERVRNRALLGVAATLAIGLVYPSTRVRNYANNSIGLLFRISFESRVRILRFSIEGRCSNLMLSVPF